MDSLQIIFINRQLQLKWGDKYRIVEADKEFETRYRKFSKFDNSGNYLGEAEETGRFRKYPNCRHCIVLEKNVRDQPVPIELKDWNGWEIIWPFKKPGSDEPIDPTLEVCMYITDRLENGVRRTAQDWKKIQQQEHEAEVERVYGLLGGD